MPALTSVMIHPRSEWPRRIGTSHRHKTRHTLNDLVHHRTLSQRALLAKAINTDANNHRVDGFQ